MHKQRNVLNAVPRRERGEVQAELVGIWGQPTKQEALTQLTAFSLQKKPRYAWLTHPGRMACILRRNELVTNL